MSLVGPRPEREMFVRQLLETNPYYGQRLVVRPGLTGWAQIKAPYASSFEESIEKLKYDLYYIKNMSLFLDLSILLSTARIVLLGSGAR
jgi:lipopolysaccharide/colanic/teichoic acid biosynthesis glycosyltransferase